jgi:hypothetical protein
MKICGQKPVNFFRDYWFGLLLMFLSLTVIPSLDTKILEIILPDLLNPVQVRGVLIIFGLLGVWVAWDKFIGKKF